MKNKRLIIIVSFLAVVICLIITGLLFYTVSISFLIVLALTIGLISGIFITLLAHNLINAIRNKRINNEK